MYMCVCVYMEVDTNIHQSLNRAHEGESVVVS